MWVCVCVRTIAERNDPSPSRGPLLAGGPHQAGVQWRRTVPSGQPADSLHRLPPHGINTHISVCLSCLSCLSTYLHVCLCSDLPVLFVCLSVRPCVEQCHDTFTQD